MVDIFTNISQHIILAVVYLTQKICYTNKQTRTLSLNSYYIVMFKNARDANQVANLVRQMYRGKRAFMIEACRRVTRLGALVQSYLSQ